MPSTTTQYREQYAHVTNLLRATVTFPLSTPRCRVTNGDSSSNISDLLGVSNHVSLSGWGTQASASRTRLPSDETFPSRLIMVIAMLPVWPRTNDVISTYLHQPICYPLLVCNDLVVDRTLGGGNESYEMNERPIGPAYIHQAPMPLKNDQYFLMAIQAKCSSTIKCMRVRNLARVLLALSLYERSAMCFGLLLGCHAYAMTIIGSIQPSCQPSGSLLLAERLPSRPSS